MLEIWTVLQENWQKMLIFKKNNPCGSIEAYVGEREHFTGHLCVFRITNESTETENHY